MTILTLKKEWNCSTWFYGMTRDTFWKLFLSVHDRSFSRKEFLETLEKAIIEKVDPNCTRIEIVTMRNGFGWRTDSKVILFQENGKLFPKEETYRTSCSYTTMIGKCAKYFGVSRSSLDLFPTESRNKSDLQSYFIGRKASTKTLYMK